ncbi:MAG: hypothetical protein R2932_12180 [Caldilineaceae bacterium]
MIRRRHRRRRATFTETPTITPTPTATPFPFERYIGPQFFPTQNEFLTIWVKLFVGTPPNEDPAGGYYLKVLFEGFDRPSTNGTQSSAEELYAVGVPGTGYSNLTFNLKYEYRPRIPIPLIQMIQILTRAVSISSAPVTGVSM